MVVAFFLAMPSVNTWNGHWSGEGRLHVQVRRATSKVALARVEPLLGRRFRYAFGDGWCAAVDVRQVDSQEARRLRRRSQGFLGYDWMINSLLTHGRIQTEAFVTAFMEARQ